MASDAVVNLVVNAAGADRDAMRQLRRIVDDAERSLPPVDIDVNIRVDDNGRLRDAQGRFVALGGSTRDARFEIRSLDADIGRLTSVLSTAGSLMTRFTIAGGAIGGIIPLAAGLVASLANIAPAGAAAVTGMVAIQAASATLKLGLTGVSDAITAVFEADADPAKVAQALENLSDNAQDFVLQLQDMRPAFDNLRLDVQDRIFRDLDTTLENTARTVFPELRTAAQNFADTFNAMARDTGTQAQQLSREGTLGKALSSSTNAFENLRDIPGQVLLAIGRLAAGGGPLLERVTAGIADIVEGLTTRLENASASGALEDAVNQAGDTIQQLGRVVGNIIGGIGNIFSAASVSGDGLFGTLERLTQAFEDLTASEEFQTILGAVLGLGETLATNVLPLLQEAFAQLAPVIEELSPILEDIVTALGDELGRIIPELGPVLLELVRAFGELWLALEPLLPVLGDLIVALLPELIPLIRDSARLLEDMAPIIRFVAEGFSLFLVPALQLLARFFTDVNSVMVDAIDVITDVGSEALQLANAVLHGVVIPALRAVRDFLRGDFSGAWRNAQDILRNFRDNSSGSVRGATSNWVGSLSSSLSTIVANTNRSFGQVTAAVRRHMGDVIANLRTVPGRALSALGNLNSLLYGAGRALISGFISGIRSQLSAVVDAARDIVGAARDFFPFSPAKRGPFSGRGYTRFSGRKLIEDFAKGIGEGSPRVRFALSRAMNAPLIAPPGLTGSTQTEFGGSAFAGLTMAAFSRTAPSVAVFIGNEEFNGRMRVVVNDQLDDRDRQASQGVRV